MINNFNIGLGELQPLRDKIASSIRDAIIDGRIKPGERLMEPEVAKNLGVSRTPLREAFFVLESEGLVKVTPRRGAVVADLSVKDAEDTYTTRIALEALAGGLAAKKISTEKINELQSLNEKMEKLSKSEKKDIKKLLDINSKFHQIIYESCGNDKLIKMILVLRSQTLRYNYLFLSILSRLDSSIKEHYEIINSLKKNDKEKVEKLIKKHGETAKEALRSYINKKEGIPA
jgi:DNA-binding GntR family transcriptional regulator